MESYIIRIYRRERGDAVTGVVEEALSRRTVAFRSIAELSAWLLRPPGPARRKRARRPPVAGEGSP